MPYPYTQTATHPTLLYACIKRSIILWYLWYETCNNNNSFFRPEWMKSEKITVVRRHTGPKSRDYTIGVSRETQTFKHSNTQTTQTTHNIPYNIYRHHARPRDIFDFSTHDYSTAEPGVRADKTRAAFVGTISSSGASRNKQHVHRQTSLDVGWHPLQNRALKSIPRGSVVS